MEDGVSSTNSLLVSLCEREHVLYAAERRPVKLPQGDGVIDWSCRDREATWICSAARRLHLSTDSSTLAVAILDRVIYSTRVPIKYVNCVAVACLSLAKKLCEDHEEDASLYLHKLRLSYSSRELKRMELRILDLLGWDAFLPSFDRFLVALLKPMCGQWLMSPLRSHIEAIVCDSSVMSQFSPSTLALSVVSLLIEATSKRWMQAIQVQIKLCKTDPSELLSCRKRLSNIWSYALMPSLTPFEWFLPSSELPTSAATTSCRGTTFVSTSAHNGQTDSTKVSVSAAVTEVVISSPNAPQPTRC
ncbi:cyclin domain protein [Dictyocaulus viviparus]|uniref:Cyclin domain protein n=1 Tax=Dictyocaulus viviparus TaxID=29172 RepID=A0A0D8YA92_DICVI|nr:cyclin domain protein [Dictyocaulus viviparus]